MSPRVGIIRKRDFYAGALLVLLGLLAVDKGPGYGIGTLMSMGPGFKEEGVGIACGAHFAGRHPALIMQNSGFGNCANAILSLLNYYRILIRTEVGMPDSIAVIPLGAIEIRDRFVRSLQG